MGRKHRRLGQVEYLLEGTVGDMGYVDHHAEPVHLGDQRLAERRQALPAFEIVVRRVGDVVGLRVRKGDVADAAFPEVAQVGEVAGDRAAVLHAERQGDAPAGLDAVDIGGAGGDGELVRRCLRDAFDHVDELVGKFDGASRRVDARRDVDRHERGVEAAGHRAGVVEVAGFRCLADVVLIEFQPVRHIDVRVDDDKALGELLRAVPPWRTPPRPGLLQSRGSSAAWFGGVEKNSGKQYRSQVSPFRKRVGYRCRTCPSRRPGGASFSIGNRTPRWQCTPRIRPDCIRVS